MKHFYFQQETTVHLISNLGNFACIGRFSVEASIGILIYKKIKSIITITQRLQNQLINKLEIYL